MSARAMRRVERFIKEHEREPNYQTAAYRSFSTADLRAVLKLAREAAELRRRLRLARDVFTGKRAVYDGDSLDTRDAGLADLLDLRKPLPKVTR